jgi:IS1 family transposase
MREGRRGIKTAEKLNKRMRRLEISYERMAADNWERFLSVFAAEDHEAGKKRTVRMDEAEDAAGFFAGHAVS